MVRAPLSLRMRTVRRVMSRGSADACQSSVSWSVRHAMQRSLHMFFLASKDSSLDVGSKKTNTSWARNALESARWASPEWNNLVQPLDTSAQQSRNWECLFVHHEFKSSFSLCTRTTIVSMCGRCLCCTTGIGMMSSKSQWSALPRSLSFSLRGRSESSAVM